MIYAPVSRVNTNWASCVAGAGTQYAGGAMGVILAGRRVVIHTATLLTTRAAEPPYRR